MAMRSLTESDVTRIFADNDPELSRAWSSCLDGYTGASLQQRQELLDSVAILRNEFLQTFSLVNDAIERKYMIAMFYIYLKSLWTVLNVRSGYLISIGQVDLRNMCRCGLLSALLDRVERALSPMQVSMITNFLANTVAISAESSEESGMLAGSFSTSEDYDSSPAQLQARISQLEAELALARGREQALSAEFGTSDPSAIIAEFRSARSDLNVLDELENALGSMERSMEFFR